MTVYLRKTLVDGSALLLEFRGRDLSAAGVFIAADDLALLDLDEEVEVLLGTAAGPFVTARARAVRSVRSFAAGRGPTASGFGLEFLAADARFRAAIDYQLLSEGSEGQVAGDRTRTGTVGQDQGILSPQCLPIPPLRQPRARHEAV